MSLKGSKGSSSNSMNQTTTGTQDVTANNPDWVTNGVQGLLGQTMGLSSTDPQSYVAGPSQLQSQAFSQGSNLTSGADRYAGANQALTRVGDIDPTKVDSQSLLDNLDSYMSPYTQRVVDTTLNDFDVNAGRTLAQQAADGARGSQAFGGSRWGVQVGETAGELARARAAADATLRDSAFNTGAGLSNQDAQRRQDTELANAGFGMQAQTANQNAGLERAGLLGQYATGAQAADAQNLGLLSGLGETQRGIATERAQAPLQLLLAQAGLLGNLPLDLFNGQSTATTQNTTGKSKGKSASIGGEVKLF